MPRTDENGRHLTAVLDYLLDGEVHTNDIIAALRISSSTYYRRIKQADYPNAEELLRVSELFDLNFLDLLVRFGLVSEERMTRVAQHYCSQHQIPPDSVHFPRSDGWPRPREIKTPRMM
ncbi:MULTISPECIES: XRE family transcriptional regulator [unclassified Mycolicibacterium]|uniref:XRE family transcriptional regulator n=1 Tax=unclassified Mycolicibacterium TaxID=2636767 RepID=UPI00281595C2|nr:MULTISPECIES: XRE family transcriptional regulator [unclassified Mycolicibacterium]MUM04702.1 hypothetical protein [Mycolicibacterium sp. CBMA 213]